MQSKQAYSLNLDDLVRCYYPAVVRLALSILDDGRSPDVLDEAEDAAQETFIAASNALESYQGYASPKTWLFAITINGCRSRLRRRKAQRALTQVYAGLQRLLGHAAGLEQMAEGSERDAELWAAVDSLDEKHRTVVVLRYIHQLAVSEVAQVLAVNEGTVHSRLHYARRQLARQLKRSTVFEEVASR